MCLILTRQPFLGQIENTNSDLRSQDYSFCDSIALSFPNKKYDSYTDVVGPLIRNVQTDHERFRVLFRWVAENIRYNKSNRSADPDKVIQTGKAVCAGYAQLLASMCRAAGIHCEVITGYSKTQTSDIGKKLEDTDHAWNAVELYGKWYLVDVTWAAGHFDTNTRKHVQQFTETYFLQEPYEFAQKHLPKESKWQLLEEPIKKTEFSKSPLLYSAYSGKGMTAITPDIGTIKLNLKDTLEMSFETSVQFENAFFLIGNNRKAYYPQIDNTDNLYTLKQKFDRPGQFYLTLFIDGKGVAAYKLLITD